MSDSTRCAQAWNVAAPNVCLVKPLRGLGPFHRPTQGAPRDPGALGFRAFGVEEAPAQKARRRRRRYCQSAPPIAVLRNGLRCRATHRQRPALIAAEHELRPISNEVRTSGPNQMRHTGIADVVLLMGTMSATRHAMAHAPTCS